MLFKDVKINQPTSKIHKSLKKSYLSRLNPPREEQLKIKSLKMLKFHWKSIKIIELWIY